MIDWTTDFVPSPPRLAIDHAGTGPLIIFLHGIGGNRTFWRKQVPHFAQYFHAAAWDARGYGSSEDYEGPVAIRDFSADLLRTLDYFDAAKAHVVGLSMGGIIAMDFGIRYPDRVASLTVCNASNGLGDVPQAKREEFIRSRQEPLLNGKEPKDIAPDVAKLLWGKSAPRSAYDILVAGMEAIHKESFLKAIEAIGNMEGLEMEKIQAPTHIVVGEDDTLAPPEVSRAIADRIAGSEFSTVPLAGHISNVDQPEAFNAVVLPFVLRHRETAR